MRMGMQTRGSWSWWSAGVLGAALLMTGCVGEMTGTAEDIGEVDGVATLEQMLGAGEGADAPLVAELSRPLELPDARGIGLVLRVEDGRTLSRVEIDTTFDHPRLADLALQVWSPDGERVTLLAPGTLEQGGASFSTDRFADRPMTGRWLIAIYDLRAGEVGTLQHLRVSLVPEQRMVPDVGDGDADPTTDPAAGDNTDSGGSTDGGSTDGGSTDPAAGDDTDPATGDNTDSGSTDSTDPNADGGSTDDGSTDGGSTDPAAGDSGDSTGDSGGSTGDSGDSTGDSGGSTGDSGTTTDPNAGGGGSSAQVPPEVAEVVRLTNEARAKGYDCGVYGVMPAAGPVAADTLLHQAAQGHAQDMADNDYFSHKGLNGSSFVDRIRATGYQGFPMGENIAAGQSTPQQVVDGWLRSDGHCRNLMNAKATKIGVGYATGAGRYGRYWVQVFAR